MDILSFTDSDIANNVHLGVPENSACSQFLKDANVKSDDQPGFNDAHPRTG